jgi:hypothetical protein
MHLSKVIRYRVKKDEGVISAKNRHYGIISYSNRVVAPTVVVMPPARQTPWQSATP